MIKAKGRLPVKDSACYKGGSSYTAYGVFDNSSEMVHETRYVFDVFTDRD